MGLRMMLPKQTKRKERAAFRNCRLEPAQTQHIQSSEPDILDTRSAPAEGRYRVPSEGDSATVCAESLYKQGDGSADVIHCVYTSES